jgi:hypothetical protein
MRGGYQAAAGALKQCVSEDVLYFVQGLGDGWLADPHLGGHPSERAVAIQGLQQSELTQFQAREQGVQQLSGGVEGGSYNHNFKVIKVS